MRKNNIIYSLITFSIILFVWEVSSNGSEFLAFVLPPPSAIFHALLFGNINFFKHSLVTLKEMLGGILIALSIAFPFAWMMYLCRTARYILQPAFLIIQCVPIFTLAPLMVIWFGWSYISIVIPTALMIFFPLTMTIYEGLKSTPQELVDYFNVNNATPWQIFTKLQLPWSLPQLCAGLRISAAIAGIGAVAGEWAGGQNGLGLLMLESRRASDLETCFAAIFCITILSLSLYSLTVYFENKLLRLNVRKIFVYVLTLWIGISGIFLIGESDRSPVSSYSIVLDWLPNPDHIPIYVGIEEGVFERHGIPLKVYKVPDPSDPLGYLTNDKVDWAVYYMPDTIMAQLKGVGVVPVGKLIGVPLRGLIYRNNENIHQPKDLSGKIAGYSIDGTSTRCLDALHEENGIDPQKMVNIHYDLVSALGTRQVDYTYGAFWNIECEQLKAMGVDANYFTVEELGVPTYAELVILAKSSGDKASPDMIERFQSAMQECVEYCKKNPDEAFAIYAAANLDKSDKTLAWEREAWRKTIPLLPDNQQNDIEQWKMFEKWLVTHHITD